MSKINLSKTFIKDRVKLALTEDLYPYGDITSNLLKKDKLTHKYPFIQEGDKIKFLMLRQPNTVKDTVISFSTKIPYEFDLHKYVDYETQFTKMYYYFF